VLRIRTAEELMVVLVLVMSSWSKVAEGEPAYAHIGVKFKTMRADAVQPASKPALVSRVTLSCAPCKGPRSQVLASNCVANPFDELSEIVCAGDMLKESRTRYVVASSSFPPE
jgi:hypothetical protein